MYLWSCTTHPQANVKDARFDVEYFAGFALVLNGLDNLDARRHVNRMALAAGVALVESGTAGYLGQVCVVACTCSSGQSADKNSLMHDDPVTTDDRAHQGQHRVL